MNDLIFQIEKRKLTKNIELQIYKKNHLNITTLLKTNISYQILAKKDDFNTLNVNSDKISLADEEYFNKNGEKVVKIEIKDRELYEYLQKQFREANFDTYESDLLPEHRYLIDYDKKIIENEQKNTILDLKYISIDIETIEFENNPEIIMISLYSPFEKSINKVLVNKSHLKKDKYNINAKNNKNYELILLKDEKELLESLKENIIEFKPQAIIGWNVIDFDFNIIRDRMKYHNMEFKFSEYEGENRLRINKDFFKDSSLHIPGILVFDVIQLLKANLITFEDYKLNTVAKEILGDTKIDINDDKGGFKDKQESIKKLFSGNLGKLADYNFKDSVLASQIVEKLNLIRLMIQRSVITNTPLMKVKSPIASLDIMYLTELHKKNIVALSNFNFTDSNRVEGAYVIEPKKGFYEDIFIFDFKSLYPSIIMTFNIDPYTHMEKGQILAPNGAKFSKEPGILPKLINKLYIERDSAKKVNDKIKSNALKLTMNSFYGAVASPKSRFYNYEVGGAITAFAREITQKAQKYIENKGHSVIYGDTDSIFIKFDKKQFKNIEEKKHFGFEIEKEINKYFDEWVSQNFKQKNHLQIEFEKIYDKFFIASKKRYVGRNQVNKKIQFVGMEAIRGDWTDLAREFQVNLVDQIFENASLSELQKFIHAHIKKLEEGKFDNLLVYRKKITKPLSAYTKITPPHVKVARELENFDDRLVEYVMGESGPKHISLIDKNFKYDYKHYIEKQLKGVSDDLLKALGFDIETLFSGRKQKSLDKFF